jgi:hypothetical protein
VVVAADTAVTARPLPAICARHGLTSAYGLCATVTLAAIAALEQPDRTG